MGARNYETCSHCAKPGHDKESCFKLIVFPEY